MFSNSVGAQKLEKQLEFRDKCFALNFVFFRGERKEGKAKAAP